MLKYIRTQTDGQRDFYSEKTALTIPTSDTRTRQEDAKDLDITVILKRHGAQGLLRRQQFNADVDFTLDKQAGLISIAAARRFHRSLPADLLEQFPRWTDILNAINDGSLKQALEDRKNDPTITPPPKPEATT